jgi:hypothetical protein
MNGGVESGYSLPPDPGGEFYIIVVTLKIAIALHVQNGCRLSFPFFSVTRKAPWLGEKLDPTVLLTS